MVRRQVHFVGTSAVKLSRIAALAVIGLAGFVSFAQAQTKAVYEAGDAGTLTLEFAADNTVSGNYSKYGGQVKGTLKGTDRIDGFWWQTKGASDDVKCSKEMNGASYWGKFTLIEDGDRKGFHGMWGSCDEEPNEAWNGTLKQ